MTNIANNPEALRDLFDDMDHTPTTVTVDGAEFPAVELHGTLNGKPLGLRVLLTNGKPAAVGGN